VPTLEPIQQRTQSAVGNTGSGSYRQAKDVVAAAGSLSEAVENGHFLDGLDEEDQAEARAVLDALPADVDQSFMASLRDALANDKKIAFGWREGAFAHEATTDPDGTVRLWLQCPDGRTFTNRA
jgi:hypothetical protein